jgi:hypothetical protein
VYDATGEAGPDVVFWRGISDDDNITVITERAFKASISHYKRRSEAMKKVWLGLLPPVLAILWNLCAKKQ